MAGGRVGGVKRGQRRCPQRALAPLLLWLFWLCATIVSVAQGEELPASYVLLPLASFLPSSNISTLYACTPIYSSTPCSGHGTCHLLLDTLSPAYNTTYSTATTATPLPANQSNLDTHALSATTPLPLAVCVCDGGWTGRGDYLNHLAGDGDSCAIEVGVIRGLCGVGMALFSVLLLMALRRLQLWHRWYCVVTRSGGDHSGTVSVDQTPTASVRPLNKVQTAGGGSVLLRHMLVIFFLHPLSTALSCVLLIAWFALRYQGETLGISWPLTAVVYAANQPIMWTFCLSVTNTIKLAASITRENTGAVGPSNTMRAVKQCMLAICAYNAIVWTLLFYLPTRPFSEQQYLSQLVLTVCYSPVWLLSVVSLIATRRVTAALLVNLSMLSPEQRTIRQSAWARLSRQSWTAAVLLSINATVCIMLAVSDRLRQRGFVYFGLAFYISGFFSFALRLLMLHPPVTMSGGGSGHRHSGVAVAPASGGQEGGLEGMRSPTTKKGSLVVGRFQAKKLSLARGASGVSEAGASQSPMLPSYTSLQSPAQPSEQRLLDSPLFTPYARDNHTAERATHNSSPTEMRTGELFENRVGNEHSEAHPFAAAAESTTAESAGGGAVRENPTLQKTTPEPT